MHVCWLILHRTADSECVCVNSFAMLRKLQGLCEHLQQAAVQPRAVGVNCSSSCVCRNVQEKQVSEASCYSIHIVDKCVLAEVQCINRSHAALH
jgi:hypothetical protein